MSDFWNTEYGPRRVRQEPPGLEEAIFAAVGLADDPADQAAIAASLMEVPIETVQVAMLKRRQSKTTANVTFTNRAGVQRAVVVERKAPRRTARYPTCK
jgi:hypothetical protein